MQVTQIRCATAQDASRRPRPLRHSQYMRTQLRIEASRIPTVTPGGAIAAGRVGNCAWMSPVGAGIRPSTGSHAVHRHASYPNSGCEEDAIHQETQAFLKFLHEHTETKIRQDVLHRTQVGIEFFTLQKKVLKKGSVCNSAQRPGKNIARVVANSYVFRRIIKMACGSIFPVGRAARTNLLTPPRFHPRYAACTNSSRRSCFFQSPKFCKSSVP